MAAFGGGKGAESKILRGTPVRFPVIWAGWGAFMSIRRSFGMGRGAVGGVGELVVVGLGGWEGVLVAVFGLEELEVVGLGGWGRLEAGALGLGGLAMAAFGA